MFRILGALLALVLVFGLAFAEFTIGGGEVAPPGQGDEAPPTLTNVSAVRTTLYTWVCTTNNGTLQPQWGSFDQLLTGGTGEGNTHQRTGRVLNYTVTGYEVGAMTNYDSHGGAGPTSRFARNTDGGRGVPSCNLGWNHHNPDHAAYLGAPYNPGSLTTDVTYGDFSFD